MKQSLQFAGKVPVNFNDPATSWLAEMLKSTALSRPTL
jgi:hypothetical protein